MTQASNQQQNAYVAAQQAYQAWRAGGNNATREQFFLPPTFPAAFTTFNQVQSIVMPNAGYLSDIFLDVNGTITTGAGTPAGSWNTYPFLPFSLIQRVRLYTTSGVTIVQCSGMGLFLREMRAKRNQYPDLLLYNLHNSTNRALVLTSQTGTPAQSTAYTFNGMLHIPLSTDERLMLGLLTCQSNDIQVTLEITFCAGADISNITGVTL